MIPHFVFPTSLGGRYSHPHITSEEMGLRASDHTVGKNWAGTPSWAHLNPEHILLVVSIFRLWKQEAWTGLPHIRPRGDSLKFQRKTQGQVIWSRAAPAGFPSSGGRAGWSTTDSKKEPFIRFVTSPTSIYWGPATAMTKHCARHWMLSSASVSKGTEDCLGWAFSAFSDWINEGQACLKKRSLFLPWHSKHDKPQI